jgi:hypothetical protein
MTTPMAVVVDGAAEARWLAWQARGAASDRRNSRIMAQVFVVAAVLVVGWLVLAQFRV